MHAEELTTVFRAPRRRACEERLLVLTAVGIEATISAAGGEFLLQVAPHDAAYALTHLLQYEAENRPAPPPPRAAAAAALRLARLRPLCRWCCSGSRGCCPTAWCGSMPSSGAISTPRACRPASGGARGRR